MKAHDRCYVRISATLRAVRKALSETRRRRLTTHPTTTHLHVSDLSPCWSRQARAGEALLCAALPRPPLSTVLSLRPPGDHHMSDDHAFNLLEDDCSLLGSLLDECLNDEVGLLCRRRRSKTHLTR